MKQSKAITKFVRISPRKARPAADLIRGLNVDDAKVQLNYCNMKAGRLLLKTLNSAIANAETQHDARKEQLKVQEVRIDVGPVMKRGKSRNRGGVAPILKRTSHFTVIVSIES